MAVTTAQWGISAAEIMVAFRTSHPSKPGPGLPCFFSGFPEILGVLLLQLFPALSKLASKR
jgi:hypothetical protein